MQDRKRTNGLLISSTGRSGGFEHVDATLIGRYDGDDSPTNPNSGGEQAYDGAPKHLEGLRLADLGMHGFVSDSGDCEFICYDPQYRSPYSVDSADIARMLPVLRRIERQIAKDEAREAGDVFMSICRALKLDFVCWRADGAGRDTMWYRDAKWIWRTLGDGRDHYRREILAARNRTRKLKGLGEIAA